MNVPHGAACEAIGSGIAYSCFSKSVTKQGSVSAPQGYVIDEITGLINRATGSQYFEQSSSGPVISDGGRQVTITVTATGYACHRNEFGDAVNFGVNPAGDALGTDTAPETSGAEPGHVIISVRVSGPPMIRRGSVI